VIPGHPPTLLARDCIFQKKRSDTSTSAYTVQFYLRKCHIRALSHSRGQ